MPPLNDQEKHDLLYDTFYDPREGLISVGRLYKKLRPQVTYDETAEFVKNQSLTQTMAPLRDVKYDSIYTPKIRRIYCADLLDVGWWKGFNDGRKMIFVGLDIHSRRMYAVPLDRARPKSVASVLRAMKGMFAEMGVPRILVTDLEKSIMGNVIQRYLKDEDIEHWAVSPDRKLNNSMCERANLSLRRLMEKYFRTRGTKRWLDVLPDLVYNFNHSYNRMTKATPQDIWDGLAENQQKVVVNERTLQIGDVVRVQKTITNPFTKKSTQKALSKNLWTVVGRADVGRRYIVENSKGEQLEKLQRELVKVDVEKLETFVPPKKKTKSKIFKAARKQIHTDQELAREGIEQENVIAKPRSRARRNLDAAAVDASTPKPRPRVAAKKPKRPWRKGDRVSVFYPQDKRSYSGVVRRVNKRSLLVYFPEDQSEALVPSPYSFVKRQA